MKALYFSFAAVLVSGAISAQQAPAPSGPSATPEPRIYISAGEIADRIRQAQAAAQAGTQYRGAPMLFSAPFRASMEYHTAADTFFAVHETNAELFVVLDGSGTLSVGGTLVNPVRHGNNLSAPTADGAIPHPLVKGDMMLVPENTPHAITQVNGALVLMTLHMPVPAAGLPHP